MPTVTVPPRVAAIHDLSCLGRCALTAVIPVLSALGVQAVPLPTAILSTQTDGFDHLFFRDMSTEMDAITEHFSRLNLTFDAIYSGFLGSIDQIERVRGFIDRFSCGGPVIVDPVMGDDGELYQTYTPAMVTGMRELCRHADLITPNYTEACLLTETPYAPTETMDSTSLSSLCDALGEQLLKLGPRRAVITGLRTENVVRNIAYDGDSRFICDRPLLAARYPGTGDIFASVLVGALLTGNSFPRAVERACDFVSTAIAHTLSAPSTPRREGVLLESCLSALMR